MFFGPSRAHEANGKKYERVPLATTIKVAFVSAAATMWIGVFLFFVWLAPEYTPWFLLTNKPLIVFAFVFAVITCFISSGYCLHFKYKITNLIGFSFAEYNGSLFSIDKYTIKPDGGIFITLNIAANINKEAKIEDLNYWCPKH